MFARLCCAVVGLSALHFLFANAAPVEADEPLNFTVTLDVVKQELNPGFCWFHPRIASVPEMGKDGGPLVVLTLQKHLNADDHYSGVGSPGTELEFAL